MAEKEGSIILIDTNIFVDHLRNFPPAARYFESLLENKEVFFSAITEAELLAGSANEDTAKREKLLSLLSQWTKIPVTNPIAVSAGDLSRQHQLEIPDAIIAATTLLNNATLITKNIKDFKKVPKLLIQTPY